jgi:hypothetical protein
MPSPILTDGATFTCQHGGTGTVANGIISISAVAASVTIGGHKPILAGATISGFTVAAGCNFKNPAPPNNPQPCLSFLLPAPSERTLTIGGQAVYTATDAAMIASVQSTGNLVPGLSISEPQSLATA